MTYRKLSDEWRGEPKARTLGALGALGGGKAQIHTSDQGQPDSQVHKRGPPKPAKPPKVCSADLDLGLHDALDILDGRRPDHVESDRWRQAVEDGNRFLATWGERAKTLGWTARDLFGLHQPPANPHPTYSRLSRRDKAGLLWLLEGREVVALTDTTAAVRWPSGNVTTYRKSR